MDHIESLSYARWMRMKEIDYLESIEHWSTHYLKISYNELMGARDLLFFTLKYSYDYEKRKYKKNNKLLKKLLLNFRRIAKYYSDNKKKAFEDLGIVGQKYNDLISKLKQENIRFFS